MIKDQPRVIAEHQDDVLKITADSRSHGNASHVYTIDAVSDAPHSGGWTCILRFQNGPIKESGINGITNEALLVVLEDRLSGFQSGPYACQENAEALESIRSALATLHARTASRRTRGVEGTHEI